MIQVGVCHWFPPGVLTDILAKFSFWVKEKQTIKARGSPWVITSEREWGSRISKCNWCWWHLFYGKYRQWFVLFPGSVCVCLCMLLEPPNMSHKVHSFFVFCSHRYQDHVLCICPKYSLFSPWGFFCLFLRANSLPYWTLLLLIVLQWQIHKVRYYRMVVF